MATKRIQAESKTSTRTNAPKRVRATAKTELVGIERVFAVDHALIARRAFERFAARGWAHGHDLEDWLAAERELTQG